MKNLAKERIGQIRKNNFGSVMEIIEYKNNKDILVRFLKSGNITSTQYINFLNGQVANPYDRTIYNIGYIGEGKYKTSGNGKDTIQYSIWHTMFQRCYDEKFIENNKTYKNCSVCDVWHNFQTFAKWYDENYYIVDGEKMSLDKDILVKGNKIYSPETCIFVPQRVNTLFVKTDSKRGDYPIGVTFNKKNNRYMARENNIMHIGSYNAPLDAFNAYKNHKEELIKQIADKYKDMIPEKLYDALLSYKIEITD